MAGYWKKRTIALLTLSALVTSGCATWGSGEASLATTDNSWSIRKASTQVDEESVKLTVLLRKPLSYRGALQQRRHLWLEVSRENSEDSDGMAVDLNLMQRASITELQQDSGKITGVHVEFHNDHNINDHG